MPRTDSIVHPQAPLAFAAALARMSFNFDSFSSSSFRAWYLSQCLFAVAQRYYCWHSWWWQKQWLVELLHLVSQHQVTSSSWYSEGSETWISLCLIRQCFFPFGDFFPPFLDFNRDLLTFCSVLALTPKIESISDSSCWISASVFCLNASIEADSPLISLIRWVCCWIWRSTSSAFATNGETYPHQWACDYQFFQFFMLSPFESYFSFLLAYRIFCCFLGRNTGKTSGCKIWHLIAINLLDSSMNRKLLFDSFHEEKTDKNFCKR